MDAPEVPVTHSPHPQTTGRDAADTPEETSVTDLRQRARALAASGQRAILGIVGAPGSGKSTLAARLVAELGPRTAVVVPMDGFHLANSELDRLGRRERKGAPDTFDVAGYTALLQRLRDPAEDGVYAPEFRREIEEAVAGAIPVPADVPLIITEGNYLLLDEGDWASVRTFLDQVWFLATDHETRLQRLIERHVAYGKSPTQARAWSLGSDQDNADLVSATMPRADLVLSPPPLGHVPHSDQDTSVRPEAEMPGEAAPATKK
ncbi:nucleoside/nucleotide kinase family protein [Streptomyces sp. NPDC048641]|uniref:nucleoside/nucleotide kinase family protein n=1 Tax=Streptomyces sp. NPDC048641 TaxID=3154825 RepID=UPI00341CC3CA